MAEKWVTVEEAAEIGWGRRQLWQFRARMKGGRMEFLVESAADDPELEQLLREEAAIEARVAAEKVAAAAAGRKFVVTTVDGEVFELAACGDDERLDVSRLASDILNQVDQEEWIAFSGGDGKVVVLRCADVRRIVLR